MLASASDHHIFDKLNYASKEEAIEKYLQPIITALENDIVPRIHLEDCTRADIFGWVIPFMTRVLDESKGIAKFRICDTIGWGSPDPYASLPWGVPRLFDTIRRETGAELEFHGHNDFGLATANSIASWRYGGKKVNVAFAGLGERTGNTSLEQTIAALIRHYGDPGFDLKALEEMRQLVDGEVIELNDRLPLIGEVFTTTAGIHQAGVGRQGAAPGGLIYLPFAASLFGRTRSRTQSRRFAFRHRGHHLRAEPGVRAHGQRDAREGHLTRDQADLRPHPGRVQRPVRRAARPLGERPPLVLHLGGHPRPRPRIRRYLALSHRTANVRTGLQTCPVRVRQIVVAAISRSATSPSRIARY